MDSQTKKKPRAVVFAAGLGKRLHPYTDTTAKALVKVGGIPMLEHVLLKLRATGISDVVINIHHFADKIRKFVDDNYGFGMNIKFSDESKLLLDTGGGLLAARGLLDAGYDTPIVIHNADILSDLPLEPMIENHVKSGAMSTILCRHRPSPRQLYFNASNNRLVGWADSRDPRAVRPAGFNPQNPGLDHFGFGGIHVVSSSIFDALEQYRYNVVKDPVFSITPFYAETSDINDIRAYAPTDDYMWNDIGSPEKLAEADRAFNR